MNDSEIKKIIENLIPVFFEAGEESIKIFNTKLKVKTKSDNTPVSNGDLIVNEMIINKLNKLCPNIDIISEENVNEIETKDRSDLWLIDPIDGTNSYIKGGDEYTLNAGLVINKKAIAGIIYAPKKKRLFFSFGYDQSFEVNKDKKIKISCNKLNKIIVALSNSSKP